MEPTNSDLHATRIAHHLVLAALIQTHPQYEVFQLHLTRLLEQQLAPSGSLGKTLTEVQRQAVRDTVEWLQALRPVQPAAPPAPGS